MSYLNKILNKKNLERKYFGYFITIYLFTCIIYVYALFIFILVCVVFLIIGIWSCLFLMYYYLFYNLFIYFLIYM